MALAWIALNDEEYIFESFSSGLPACFPSAGRSELYALLLDLRALCSDSFTTIMTDCAQLISLWNRFINAPFSSKLLQQPNYLIWLFIRYLILDRNLKITLSKVLAHSDNALNNQVDVLAKDAHSYMQLTFSPSAFINAPCILLFDSLPIDMNIWHFIRSVREA
ncbi:hypothetical protein RhiirA4_484618 [Rhizophagus irregularis]|uniref:RNase H type-1 domain-containing protein n=1 Tax=Rhizophagus irregularis TaxID=588596 RepID=A0A2I1HP69_9GLOM|nr:hypothetical protein RhiirA4_484618 [Rhizophagus irregularis]